MGVVDRCVETGSENNYFVYEQPPPTPLALSSSPTTIPPKYREIQPRLSGCGINPKTPDDTLLLKPPRCRGGKTRQNRQRRPQGRNREPKPVQLEADANMVSFARTRSESSVPVSQYTDSSQFSSSQEPSVVPYPFSPSNNIAGPEVRLPFSPNGASDALFADRPAYHHDVPCSLDSSDIQVSWPNSFFELSQDRDSMRAVSLQFSEHLEKAQVLQSLSILQDYMAKYPSVFERQAPEMVQGWMLDIEGFTPPGSLSE
ncbi:hypothetical protein N7491_002462 [Penicillium cf. griseofulvum]|uniref:Uncharacterized protein n=1 Tax=Penicillium cf. griseofulvum TaxID=2972120 RepID=A0A9W9MSY1_9EURO|nr:hypothetical protein N7472_003354 [Penicillium cf. griseofulvum]KAJ5446380.1 hypothetical protein N7491_002462 [Penicillium cf. griseofulvum]KAJ5448122.1 hypothetical protein N7445_002943 [Penicillium cf. griseofulvum]